MSLRIPNKSPFRWVWKLSKNNDLFPLNAVNESSLLSIQSWLYIWSNTWKFYNFFRKLGIHNKMEWYDRLSCLWEDVILWLFNLYLKGSIKISIKHSQWNYNYGGANFILNLSSAPQEHTPTRIQLFSLFDKPVPRKGELFTINFIETVKPAEETFTLLQECTSYPLRVETVVYLLSKI